MYRKDQNCLVTYLIFWEWVTAVCENSHCVDHNGRLRHTPSHYHSSNAKMILEGCTERNKATDIEWHWDIACPVRPWYLWDSTRLQITRNLIPKTAFSLENTFVSLDANIHDVVISISANQFSDNHCHLMATVSPRGYRFYNQSLTIGVP